MEIVKKRFWKCLDFIYKHKVVAFLFAFAIATSFILYGVLANDDEYAGNLAVTNTSFTSIADGTNDIVPFDGEEGAGKDTSATNGVLRNYDSITYSAQYKLELKSGTITDPIEGRNVVVDVIIPKTINATLLTDYQTGEGPIEALSLDQNFNYFEFVIDNVSATTLSTFDEFSFTLNSVNTKVPNTTFSPVVLIQEATDNATKPISAMSTDEKEALMGGTLSSKITCTDTQTMLCSTTMTGTYDFDVAFYQGAYSESQNTLLNKKFPIGIGVVVPNNRIIGIYVPNSISFKLDVTPGDGLTVDFVENSFANYKDLSKNYTILYDDTHELPSITNTVSYENGIVTISNLKLDKTTNAIGTAAFEISSTRATEADKNNRTIHIVSSDLKIGDTVVKTVSGDLDVTDYYEKFVGKFGSRIDIYPAGSVDKKIEGNAFVSLNQPIRLEETITYAADGIGDDLSELHTYIKIDPEAFLFTKDDNSVDSGQIYIMRYGYGEWSSEYFTVNSGNGCPTGNLTKEDYMNLFGGPCLTPKDTFVWNDDTANLPLIVVDAVFGAIDDDTTNVSPSSTSIITLNGKIKGDVSILEKSYQVSTISTGVFNNQLYYLSSNINSSDVTNAKNPKNYKKSTYNYASGTFGTNNSNPCNDYFCHITGDTVHVMPFAVNYPEVQAYFNDVPKSTFYDYPIEWRINQTVDTYVEDIQFSGARVAVAIPDTLNYLYAEILKDGKRTRKEATNVTNVSGGKVYTYNFSEDEIHNGTIDTLSVFTDAFLNTRSGTKVGLQVVSDFDGYVLDGTTIIPLHDTTIFELRTKYAGETEITLNNSSDVNTAGNATPRYIEKGQSYTYTMRAYNSSNSDTNNGYSFANAALYYVLPYIEDSNYKIYKKTFTNTSYKIKLNSVPAGYKVYYTTDAAVNVVSDIYSVTNPDSQTVWKEDWNGSTDIVATAIKIVKNDNWDINTYFGPEEGITAVITPVNNAQADSYYNGFVISAPKPAGYPEEPCDVDYETCTARVSSDNLYYQSSKSLVEVYSRKISGFVFEDYNYSDLYELGEKQIENTIVELYKLSDTTYPGGSESSNPNLYVNSELDELVATTTTDSHGGYEFTGLGAGNYYVLYRYDGVKYTPCDKYGGEVDHVPNATQNNSKAVAKNLADNEAISDIITLSASSSDVKGNMNLGLRIRKEFGVEINKYITNIVQTSNQGTKVYEYNKATKVNIDIKNMKNTKFRVTYNFDIVNTKFFPGYVGIIADLVPAGMTFDGTLEENKDWTIYDGVLYYTGLQDKLLFPGDKHYFSLVLDLDTNQGGTYLNIVAAQQPILMGEETSDYDFTVTVDTDTPVETGTGDNSGSQGNGE